MTPVEVSMTVEEATRAVLTARDPSDLFGPLPADDTVPAAASSAHRRLARLLHPDTPGGDAALFTRLTGMWTRYQEAVRGRIGFDDHVVVTASRGYHVGSSPLASGDVADLYPVRYQDGGWRDAVIKVPRSPRDNDLMEAEATALERIRERGPEEARAFFPRLLESIRHRDAATGVERRANVLDRLDGFHSLADVRRAYPDGVDPRDAAWMWRRLLVAVDAASRAGVVHGAVVPEHVLIHPGEHGLVLVDWCYSVTAHAARTAPHIPAMVPHRKDLYPPEVAERGPASVRTDIYMATRCIEYITAGRLPRELRSFARGCALPAARQRPSDGFALLIELDEVLERLYGPRRFRPFTMPD
ncbi:molecular chaperone DnaJ [Nocardiopsis changdeensis]|uniref:Molecular chaperone DnaJ n=1 Tax=Nocardiopsis changdeensis TaxID=2831969 RepID=A0ABX8BKJ2_9ACTN|nr:MULTISPECIES: molecular chaperone DnaJ [Nocardiopsis]QUX21328.1 molecular chaperone DnaJ [Nocardiopsis changdeensis]QYX37259.1 molecular chaperone DnaJ [Nocardiopsis sp. MT53]